VELMPHAKTQSEHTHAHAILDIVAMDMNVPTLTNALSLHVMTLPAV
jgi:hypothetical protein